jgi:hypothetical protein
VDGLEKCVEKTKDPQLCSFLRRVGELAGGLVDCVEEFGVRECFDVCLRRCQGEGCEAACLSALEAALGVVEARRMARGASLVAVLLGVDPTYAVAAAFETELEKAERMECPQKAIAGRVLAAAAVELYKSFQIVPPLQKDAQDVLTLMAPALALAYQCVGEEVFEYLELIRPFIGEDATRRIVAALEEGGVIVGGETIRFKPVKVKQ